MAKAAEGKMSDCIARFSGDPAIDDPAALCSWMRSEGVGYFSEEATEEDILQAVEAYGKREAQPGTAHGALQRAKGKIKNLESLREAIVDRANRTIDCIILVEGPGNLRDRNYYGPEAIASAARRINGSKSFINHETAREAEEMPERDVWDLAGYWSDGQIVEVDDGRKAVRAKLHCDRSPAGDEALAKAEAAIEYAKLFPDLREVYAGLSVNGDGDTEPRDILVNGTESKWNYVKDITDLPSTDVVTRPAREGQFLKLVESIRGSNITEEVREAMKDTTKKSLTESAEALAKAAKGEITIEEAEKIIAAEAKKVATLKAAEAKETETEDESEEEAKARKAKAAERCESEEETEAEDESEDEGDVVPPEDEEDTEDGGTSTVKIKHEETRTKKESVALRKENADLKKRLAETDRKVVIASTKKALEEAGIDEADGIKAEDLAAVDSRTRKVVIGLLKTREAAFGGTAVRGANGGSNSIGDQFVAALGRS